MDCCIDLDASQANPEVRQWLDAALDSLPIVISRDSLWRLRIEGARFYLSHLAKPWRPFCLAHHLARYQSVQHHPIRGALTRVQRGKARLLALDACAGWGADGQLLACSGYQTRSVERHPTVYLMLKAWLHWESNFPPQVWDVVFADSQALLPGMEPDVLWVDPMFCHPTRSKSQKPMQLLALLCEGACNDGGAMITWAIQSNVPCVFIKRPKHARPIQSHRQTSVFHGKGVAYWRLLLPA